MGKDEPVAPYFPVNEPQGMAATGYQNISAFMIRLKRKPMPYKPRVKEVVKEEAEGADADKAKEGDAANGKDKKPAGKK